MIQSNRFEFYIGGYGAPGEKGVLKCAFDGRGFELLGCCDALRNPSWLLRHPRKPLLYAVEELSPEGRLAVLAEQDGHLRVMANVTSGGADPCHIAIAPDGRHLFVSNYTGGSLAVYALDEDGLPGPMTDFVRHRMDGPGAGDPVRQDAPHIHFSLCDGERVYVNDLGLNRVFVYDWDSAGGRLIDRGRALDFPQGSGPRHLAFGPDGAHLYALCELDASLHVFRRTEGGDWRRVQAVSAVPESAQAVRRNGWTAAAIHFADAHMLCASIRGRDSLAIFRVEGDGLLSDRRLLSSGGRTPRDFLVAGPWLLAANQDSDAVCAFMRAEEGYAPLNAVLPAVRPTCLCPGGTGPHSLPRGIARRC